MRHFFLAFGILPIVSACVGQPALPPKSTEPKPVLVLSERIDWGGSGHPWPIELRLVAYDNGLIIQQPVKNDPLTKPQFVWQKKTPDEVSALVAEVKAAGLDHIQVTHENVPLAVDAGFTSIEYRDSESAESLVKATAYDMPCAAEDSDAQVAWKALARSATDSRFLQLCDKLLRLPRADAKEWYPDEMTVALITVNKQPDKIVPWPEAWPRKWSISDEGSYKKIEVCAPVGPRPDDLTAQILDPRSEAWSQSIAVKQDGSEWWIVIPFAARIAMPGAVSPWADGPCSTALK
jgi:hypothetical protein